MELYPFSWRPKMTYESAGSPVWYNQSSWNFYQKRISQWSLIPENFGPNGSSEVGNRFWGGDSPLNDFLSKLVCNENEECCMMSCCDTCKNNFDQYMVKKIIDRKKVISWDQWINVNERAMKKIFSGKNKPLSIVLFCSH